MRHMIAPLYVFDMVTSSKDGWCLRDQGVMTVSLAFSYQVFMIESCIYVVVPLYKQDSAELCV